MGRPTVHVPKQNGNKHEDECFGLFWIMPVTIEPCSFFFWDSADSYWQDVQKSDPQPRPSFLTFWWKDKPFFAHKRPLFSTKKACLRYYSTPTENLNGETRPETSIKEFLSDSKLCIKITIWFKYSLRSFFQIWPLKISTNLYACLRFPSYWQKVWYLYWNVSSWSCYWSWFTLIALVLSSYSVFKDCKLA